MSSSDPKTQAAAGATNLKPTAVMTHKNTTPHRSFCRAGIAFLTATCLLTSPILAQDAANKSGEDAPELTAKASQAIDKGLKFLLSTQKKDGSWDTDGEGGRVIGLTSLAMMAFMAKAQFHGSKKNQRAVARNGRSSVNVTAPP